MYKLYTDRDVISTTLTTLKVKHEVLKMNSFFLENDMTISLHVPRLIDPEQWLVKPFSCIVGYRFKTIGDENESLEILIQSPVRAGKYYAIGEKEVVLISTTNVNDSFEMYVDTINMLLKRSVYCHLPFIKICLDCCKM